MEEISIDLFFNILKTNGFIGNKRINEDINWINLLDYLDDYKYETIKIYSCDFGYNNIEIQCNLESKYSNIKYITFIDCNFNKLNMESINLNLLSIEECKFNNVDIIDSDIKTITINSSQFDILKLGNNTINNKLAIKSVECDNFHLLINECNNLFLKDLTINNEFLHNSNIISSIEFNDVKTYKIDIKECIYKNDIIIHKLFSNSITKIENTRFNGSIIINDLNTPVFELNNNHYDKNYATFKNLKFKNANLETYRVLKMFAQKNYDNLSYLKYNKLEQNCYLKENDIKFYDKLIIYLKKYISDFGTNWIQALLVTILITLLIFYLPIFYFLKSNVEFCSIITGEFWNGYLKFLIITDYSNPLKIDKTPITNVFLNTWLFFGKIIMAVCIYEIIISFRKYHK